MTRLKNIIIEEFKIEELGVDFMGYEFENKRELTYHHIQPKNCGGKTTFENGSILIRTSHNYIHLIENLEYKLFLQLSRELLAEHCDGITSDHLLAIRDMLEFFEDKYKHEYTKRGVPIIKEEFVRRRKV